MDQLLSFEICGKTESIHFKSINGKYKDKAATSVSRLAFPEFCGSKTTYEQFGGTFLYSMRGRKSSEVCDRCFVQRSGPRLNRYNVDPRKKSSYDQINLE